MKTSIVALAIGVALACPAAAYADGLPNIFEDLFQGSDYSHRPHYRPHYRETMNSAHRDPFKPSRTDGLSSNPDACASYGCVGVGGQ
jgi:hypothetical protein